MRLNTEPVNYIENGNRTLCKNTCPIKGSIEESVVLSVVLFCAINQMLFGIVRIEFPKRFGILSAF